MIPGSSTIDQYHPFSVGLALNAFGIATRKA